MSTSYRMLAAAAAVATLPLGLDAQDRTAPRREPRVMSFSMSDDSDRPRLGVSTGLSGKRDTLGLLVTSTTRGGPADRAGIEEGDRIQSINGVNLRLSPVDADESEMDGTASRRLTRELGKLKIGDEADLRVYRDGQTRSVKVKTVHADDLRTEAVTVSSRRRESEERATLGIGLGMSGSRRDTLGVLIASVVDDGPADKARIEEGDRIAAINGVDLRVAREDAGDWASSNSRMRRLTREMDKVKAGDEVELRLIRGGQSRSVRVRSVPSKDLPNSSRAFFFGEGGAGFMDGGRTITVPPMGGMLRNRAGGEPFIFFDRNDDGGTRLRFAPEARAGLERRIESLIDGIGQPRIQLFERNRTRHDDDDINK